MYAIKGTHLLVISKETFKNLILFYEKRKLYELSEFLKQIPLFIRFTNLHLKRLINFLLPIKRPLHAYIIKEGEPAIYMFIIKSGSFRVCKKQVDGDGKVKSVEL